jgi:hypothetical protein
MKEEKSENISSQQRRNCTGKEEAYLGVVKGVDQKRNESGQMGLDSFQAT